jgi:hypothetical protein
MIVYGEAERAADPGVEMRSIGDRLRGLGDLARPEHDLLRGELIAFGEVEAGLADALCADSDRDDVRLTVLRHAAISLGRALWRSWRKSPGHGARAATAEAARLILRLADEPWPAEVSLRTPEGYAHYALYPESYGEAAARLATELRSRSLVVIGIRSIGTSLSAVAAAALAEAGIAVESWSVRPRGHPFSRHLELDPGLVATWAAAAGKGAAALVVDEGPGLSGSSFLAVSAALARAGFPEERIVLMPSWAAPAPPMADAPSARHWERAIKRPVAEARLWWPNGPPDPVHDLSAGRWRGLLLEESAWPAVQPQHERRKHLAGEGPVRRLWKFAGLGSHGRARHRRAAVLAEAGFIPAVHGFTNGFLVQQFVPGTPLHRDRFDRRFAGRVRDYIAFRSVNFATGRPARTAQIAAMIRTNLREAFGAEFADAAEPLLRTAGALAEVGTVAVDGRMMPHEWLETPSGFMKTDAVDHADDHFFPRDQDPAWDVAGLAVEFGLSPEREREFVLKVANSIADKTLPNRLQFYTLAYLAFHLGYAELAVAALDDADPDAARFRLRAQQLRNRIRQRLTITAANAGR